MRHPGLDPGSPNILDNTQAGGSRINLQKPQILRDDEMGLRMTTPDYTLMKQLSQKRKKRA